MSEEHKSFEPQAGPPKSKEKSKFRPGAFKPIVEVLQDPRTEIIHRFSHSHEGIEEMMAQFGIAVSETERSGFADPMGAEEAVDLTNRLVSITMAKKLAVTMIEDDAIQYGPRYRFVAQQQITVPSWLVPVIDNFGSFEVDGVKNQMIGQPAWCLTYIGRALALDVGEMTNGVELEVDRNGFFVNLRDNDPFGSLLDLIFGTLNAWGVSQPLYELNLGGNVIVMKVPYCGGGFTTYAGFIAPLNPPAEIQRMVRMGVMIEQVRARENIPGIVNGPEIRAFAGVGVNVVNWSRNDYDTRFGVFVKKVTQKLRGAMDVKFKCTDTVSFSNEGSVAQLSKRINAGSVVTRFMIPADKRVFAWMIAGKFSHYDDGGEGFVLKHKQSHSGAIDVYLRNADKSKN